MTTPEEEENIAYRLRVFVFLLNFPSISSFWLQSVYCFNENLFVTLMQDIPMCF
jgi:hypothetical protein